MRNYSERSSIKICEQKCNSARVRQTDSFRFYDNETNSLTERKKDFYNKNFATTFIKSENSLSRNKCSSLSAQELNQINPLFKQKRKFEKIIKQIPSLKKESLNIAKLYQNNLANNSSGKPNFSSVNFNLSEKNRYVTKYSESKQKFINDMLNRNPIKNVIGSKNYKQDKVMDNINHTSKIKHYKNNSISNLIFNNDQSFYDPRKNGLDKITNTNLNPSIKFFSNDNKKSKLFHIRDNKQTYFI
jgi:hypothetical protein